MTTTTHDPAGEILDAVLTGLGRLLLAGFALAWLAVLFPMISIPAGLSLAAGWRFGWPVGVLAAGVSVAGMVLWRVSSPQTFERWLTLRVRARWLAWFRYRRRWARLMSGCGLSITEGEQVWIPRLTEVLIGDVTDIVRAKMLPGHCPDGWTNRAAHLAHGFGAQHARVRMAGPGQVEIVFRHTDSLADPVVVPFDPPARLKSLPLQSLPRKAA
ncbi:hypothetical protein [Nocardia lasii]|uniref:Uncharacterized protein n=1 Tax=Nocardia lasii TaxID=1616107 RepID=A0ABW1JUQ0_9NOCA